MPWRSAIELVGAHFALNVQDVMVILSAAALSKRNAEEMARFARYTMLRADMQCHVNVHEGSVTKIDYEMPGRQLDRLVSGVQSGTMKEN
jgi:hypothetical protein